jgi:hypothetical protein
MKKIPKKKELLTRSTIERLRETICKVYEFIKVFILVSVNNNKIMQVARSHYKPMLSVLRGNLV